MQVTQAGSTSPTSARQNLVAGVVTDMRRACRKQEDRKRHVDPVAWAEDKDLTLWGQCPGCQTCDGWEPRGDKYGPTHSQIDVWRSIQHNRETYVHAGHAEGKTWTAGAITAWWMDTFPDGIVITTASSWLQVKRQLWKEIRRIHTNLQLEGEAHHLHWELSEDHFAQGLSTNDVNNLRGFHEGRVLFIIDEASGVDPEVFDAADQVLTGPYDRLLALTNPVRRASITFERQRENRGSHLRLTVPDCLDWQDSHPDHGIKGLVSWTWMQEVAVDRWRIDSAKYRIHVLGLYPETDERYLFPPDLVGAAMDRYETTADRYVDRTRPTHEPRTKPDQMGVDVAGVGRDKTIWAARFGSMLIDIIKEEALTNHPEHRLEVEEFHWQHKPTIWMWDALGEGSGTEAELQASGLPVDRFVGGSNPEEPDKYLNRRTEAFFHFRDWLKAGGAIPPNEDLRRQLQAIEAKLAEKTVDDERYTVYALLPKEQLAKDIGQSPDEADACAMAVTPPAWEGRPETIRNIGE